MQLGTQTPRGNHNYLYVCDKKCTPLPSYDVMCKTMHFLVVFSVIPLT